MYKHISDAQLSLHTDSHIQKIEEAMKHKELQRADKAHTLKAAGSSTGMSLQILRCPLVLTDPFFFFKTHILRKSSRPAPCGVYGLQLQLHVVPKTSLFLFGTMSASFSLLRLHFVGVVPGAFSGLTCSCQRSSCTTFWRTMATFQ